jgi:hypothetical protein
VERVAYVRGDTKALGFRKNNWLDDELAEFVLALRFGNERGEGVYMNRRLTDNQKNDWGIDKKREKYLKSLVQTT